MSQSSQRKLSSKQQNDIEQKRRVQARLQRKREARRDFVVSRSKSFFQWFLIAVFIGTIAVVMLHGIISTQDWI